MDAAVLKKLFPHASQAFIDGNCGVAGGDGLGSAERKPGAIPARPGDVAPRKVCRTGVSRGHERSGVRVRIAFVACLARELDDDNLVGGLKHLRDVVARELGVDDGDRRLVWEYGQTLTRGRQQTIVKISVEDTTNGQ